MKSLQEQLNLFPITPVVRDYSSEEFIASRLSESPTGQIRLMESILERNKYEESDQASH